MWAVKEESSHGGEGRRGIWGRERIGEYEPLMPRTKLLLYLDSESLGIS